MQRTDIKYVAEISQNITQKERVGKPKRYENQRISPGSPISK